LRVERGDLEARKQVSLAHLVPFGLGKLEDAGGLRRCDQKLRSGRGLHDPCRRDDGADGAFSRWLDRYGDLVGSLDLFGGAAVAAVHGEGEKGREKRANDKASGHGRGAPIARSSSARAT